MKLVTVLSPEEFNALFDKAQVLYNRIDPRRAWTPTERRDAVRWYIRKILLQNLGWHK
jgi:hypothetical protein